MNVTERMAANIDLAGVGVRMLNADDSFDYRRFATTTVFLLSEMETLYLADRD